MELTRLVFGLLPSLLKLSLGISYEEMSRFSGITVRNTVSCVWLGWIDRV